MSRSAQELHRFATKAMSIILAVIGPLLIVITFVRGGGVLSLGVIVGAMILALGCSRLYLLRK